MPREAVWIIVTACATLAACTDKAANQSNPHDQRRVGTTQCDSVFPPQRDFYFDLQTKYYVSRSNSRITIQPDTSHGAIPPDSLFRNHPCLLRDSGVTYLDRGFYVYHLATGWTFETAEADLFADPEVNRVVPIYVWDTEGAVFKVTDLIDVQFEGKVKRDSALVILSMFNLHFCSESPYRAGLWVVRLDDQDTGSPLACGNALHVTEGVEWACATQYVNIVLFPPWWG